MVKYFSLIMMMSFFNVVNVVFAETGATSSEPIPQSEIDPQAIPQESCNSCKETFKNKEPDCWKYKSMADLVRCRHKEMHAFNDCMKTCID